MESSQSSSSGNGRWASGRKLSSSQRERKRAIDRKRVSKRREQDAQRVAALESQLAQALAELEALKRTTASDPRAIGSEAGASIIPQSNTPSELLYNQPWEETSLDHLLGFSDIDISIPLSSGEPTNHFQSSGAADNGIAPASATHPDLPIETSISQLASEAFSLESFHMEGPALRIPLDRGQGSDCQRIIGRPVQKAQSLTAKDVCTDVSLNDDALIRGIMGSWADVKARSGGFICPLWAAIEDLDMRIFAHAGPLTRLPCLRMIHSMLLCFVKASSIQDLPYWYRPVKAQYQCRHPFATDLLPWPSLRERAIVSQDLTRSNKFWTDLVYHFRMGFPPQSTIHDAVTHNLTTDRWRFTGTFLNHMYEIREWHVDPQFFINWPETYYDIVPAPEIGRSLSLLSVPSSTAAAAASASCPTRPLNGFQWQTATTAVEPGPGARGSRGGGRGDKALARRREQRLSLPLPAHRGRGAGLLLHLNNNDAAADDDDDDDELDALQDLEESWHILPWRLEHESISTSVPRSGFMPAAFVQ